VIKPHERHRLHIEALLLDLFYEVQGKFLERTSNGHEGGAKKATTDCTDFTDSFVALKRVKPRKLSGHAP
jgi:hypothetical protein